MSINIEISHNFFQMEKLFRTFGAKIATPATRRALNRAMVTTRKESIKEVRKNLNVKVGVLRKKHIFGNTAKGGNIKSMFASIKFSGRPIPLLDFVVGSKQPRDQKGIAVTRRKGLKVQIKPGRKIKLRHAFIADVKSKQVFKREGPGRSKLKKQGVTSVGAVVQSPKRRIMPKLTKVATSRFNQVFVSEINARLDKVTRRPRLRRS